MNFGILILQLDKQRNKIQTDHFCRNADRDRASEKIIRLFEQMFQLVKVIHDLEALLINNLSLFRDLKRLAAAYDQGRSKFLFYLMDHLAEHWLCDIQLLSCA